MHLKIYLIYMEQLYLPQRTSLICSLSLFLFLLTCYATVQAQTPVLTVSKRTDLLGPVVTGTQRDFYYIVKVTNTSNVTATGVEIRDNLSNVAPGVTYNGGFYTNIDGTASQSSQVAPVFGATNLVFGNYTIPANSSIELYFQVRLASTVPAGSYNNSAQVFFNDPTSATPVKVTPGGTFSNGTPVGGSNYNGATSNSDNVVVITSNTRPTATPNTYTGRQSLLVFGNVITDGTPDSDPNGGTTLSIVPGSLVFDSRLGNLVLAETGQFSFLPAPGVTGTVTFTYRITDNSTPAEVSDPATVTINITPLRDLDGDGIADIADLDDDNDGILDIVEAGCLSTGTRGNNNPRVGVINNSTNLIANSDFGQGLPTNLNPVPQFVPAGTPWGGGNWTSGVPYAGYNVYPVDTRVSIQRGLATYLPNGDLPPVPQYNVNSGFLIVQGAFAGDTPFDVPASDTYLYSNGNSTGQQYVICQQQITGLIPDRYYILVAYTSNAINPLLPDPTAPEDGIMQFYVDNQPVGEGYVVYKDADPRSGHGGRDRWDRRQVVFRATAPTATFELRDSQLGTNGDDFVITYAGVFPYNDYSCAGFPADPSGDEDNDGTPNWQDADDPALGPLGLNANGIRLVYVPLDLDNDGRLNQFDLDSDGDGCPDANEAQFTQVTPFVPINALTGGTVGPGGISAAYGNNGFLNALELLSTTGGNPVETGTMNYIPASQNNIFNFLNNAVSTVCTNLPPVAQSITDTLVNPNRPIPPATSNTPLRTVTLSKKLRGTDQDGTIQSYVITSVPAVGILYYNAGGASTKTAITNQTGQTLSLTLTPQEMQTLAYEPPAGYSGTVTFNYYVIDNGGVPSANVGVYTMLIINRPVAVDDQAVVVVNTPNVPVAVTVNDTDPDADVFTPGLSELDVTSIRIIAQPPNGTASVVNNEITYTPKKDFKGSDSLVYVICDRTPRITSLRPDEVPLCDTAVVRFTVREPFIPEGFTPNGDGQHDFFVIENPNNDQITLQIFNRWGNLVFESNDLKSTYRGNTNEFSQATGSWDGKANRGVRIGEELPAGTYFYVVRFRNSGFNKARFMTILR